MIKKGLRFPHTISYRLTDEDYFRLEQEVNKTKLTPHDWCRMVVLERLNQEYGLSKIERILFEQSVGIHYLVANGFQLLADDRLTTDEWKKLRMFVKEKIDIIAQRALDHFRSKDAKQRTAVGLHGGD